VLRDGAPLLGDGGLNLSRQQARRLALNAQKLAGPKLPATKDGLLQVVRAIRCIQIDSVGVAGAPTQYLVPFSRLGPYDRKLLDSLVFEDRILFHYLAHALSLVLTEDFQLFSHFMTPYASRPDGWGRSVGAWMEENATLRDHV